MSDKVQSISFDNVTELGENGWAKKRKMPPNGNDATIRNAKPTTGDKNNTNQPKGGGNNNNNNNKTGGNNNKKKRRGEESSDDDDDDDGLKDLTPEQLVKRYKQNKRKEEQLRRTEEDKLINKSKYGQTVHKLEKIDTKSITHNQHRHHMENQQQLARTAALENIYADEFLQQKQEGSLQIHDKRGILSTRHITQADLLNDASETVKRKAIHLQGLEHGPYQSAYSNNGKFLLLCGQRGQVCNIDWKSGQVLHEVNVKDQIFDCTYLQDHTIYALAQRGNVHIYDREGIEVHALKHESTQYPRKLDFLPYHYLLVAGTQQGFISYRDVSTGKLVCHKKTKMGQVLALRQNPQNAVMAAGHGQGLVTMWTPNMQEAVVTMKVHASGALTDLAIDESGRYMCSAGTDGYVKLWDIRNYKEIAAVKQYVVPQSLDISFNNYLALGAQSHMTVYKLNEMHTLQHSHELKWEENQALPEATRPRMTKNPAHTHYIHEQLKGQVIDKVRFVPYEDLLGVGMHGAYRHLIVPGSGAANFDSWAANPFENKSQRRERVVRSLLEKLQPEMITMDTHIFNVMDRSVAKEESGKQLKAWNDSFKHKIDFDKDRARENLSRKENRKKLDTYQENREKLTEALNERRDQERAEKAKAQSESAKSGVKKEKTARSALDRFL